MKKDRMFFGANILLALFFLIYAVANKSVYIYDGVLYIVASLFFWKYGKRLGQNYLSISLIFAALIYHNLGTFGLFSNPPFGLPYDKILHFFSGIYLSYALFLLGTSRGLSRRTALFFAMIGSLGIGAIGELNEFAGWQIFPPKTSFEGGLLDPGVGKFLGDPNYLAYVYLDTIKDMAMNLSGAILTSLVLSVRFLKGKRKK